MADEVEDGLDVGIVELVWVVDDDDVDVDVIVAARIGEPVL